MWVTICDANKPVRSVLLADHILTRFALACVFEKIMMIAIRQHRYERKTIYHLKRSKWEGVVEEVFTWMRVWRGCWAASYYHSGFLALAERTVWGAQFQTMLCPRSYLSWSAIDICFCLPLIFVFVCHWYLSSSFSCTRWLDCDLLGLLNNLTVPSILVKFIVIKNEK